MDKLNNTFNFYDATYIKSYNLDKSIKYQLSLLDSLDLFTRQHSENVATITCNLCKKLHLSRSFTEYCTTCAYLHDVGKLFIPVEILQKPSKLTDEEFEIMKTHTTLGYKLCIKDDKLRPYYAGPYYHHECLDGTGYPQGLFENDIPYEAQIIKVADEYDALVHKRQYKSHIGISESLKIIIERTKPSPEAIPNTKYSKLGKNNKTIVKKLLKVVINDIEYEISCTDDYVKHLSKEIERYETVRNYLEKSYSAKNQKDKTYFEEYAKLYLSRDESLSDYENLYKETVEAYKLRKSILSGLYDEIKTIKKLRV